MPGLQGKNILVGVCGGIAAYKTLTLIRLLRKDGANVRVILTPAARDFTGTVTASALSGGPVLSDLFDPRTGSWTNHVELGLWADLFIIAPLTASTLSKMCMGQADNLLVTTYLSARCPVWVAPAMDLDMWQHPSTCRNIRMLETDGVRVLHPESGLLASGLSGPGRMQEPEDIHAASRAFFQPEGPLAGAKVLVTLGPTREDLDPVRFISNHSSGKMGAALVSALLARGAEVFAVAGPVAEGMVPAGARHIPVQTAQEMLEACLSVFDQCRAAILAAAVADYRPARREEEKIKKKTENLTLELVKNPDIAARLGSKKTRNQFLIGFALETSDGAENAREKLRSKNLDAIVLNSLRDPGTGFGLDTNTIRIFDNTHAEIPFETKSKAAVADDIVQYLAGRLA